LIVVHPLGLLLSLGAVKELMVEQYKIDGMFTSLLIREPQLTITLEYVPIYPVELLELLIGL